MTLQAIVLRNPWAPLVAMGIKQWELRGFQPRTTLARGDDLAIVMGRGDDREAYPAAWDRWIATIHARLKTAMRNGDADPDQLRAMIDWAQPGHVLGVARYQRAIPVRAHTGFPSTDPITTEFQFNPSPKAYPSRLCLVTPYGPSGARWNGMEDQADLAPWTPGSQAWELDEARPLEQPVPCPAKNDDGSRLIMQGVFALPGSVETAVRSQLP